MSMTRTELLERMSWGELLDHIAEQDLTAKEEKQASEKAARARR
jgi:hypothetical protein